MDPGRPARCGHDVAAVNGDRMWRATLDGDALVLERSASQARAELAAARAAIGAPPPTVRSLPQGATERAAGQRLVEVTVDGWRLEVRVEDLARAALREQASRVGASRAGTARLVVRAQIPGRVVSVRVQAGEAVEAGQRLLSVEAMKMENEIRAQRAGLVERVAVAPGQRVERGDELAVLA